MSYAATQKQHHIHVPWMTLAIVAVAVAAAAALLILVNQPVTQTTTGEAQVAPAAVNVGAAAVALPETPALRQQLTYELAHRVPQSEQFAYPRNHVPGTTLSSQSVLTPTDAHPFNHFPSEP